MRNFQLISRGVDMGPLHLSLSQNPDLWNENAYRTQYENTPHQDVDDILIRYSAKLDDLSDHAKVQNDVGNVWYPAVNRLPEVKGLVLNLMAYLEGFELGRVLISRTPPGGRILPHSDAQGDYVYIPRGGRYHLVVQGLPGSMFRCGDEEVCMQTGEVWWFNHLEEHELCNNSADDRIHLMTDIIRWPT